METPPKQDDITALVHELEEHFHEGVPCEAYLVGQCPHLAFWYLVRSCGCPIEPWCATHRSVVDGLGNHYCRMCGSPEPVSIIWRSIQ